MLYGDNSPKFLYYFKNTIDYQANQAAGSYGVPRMVLEPNETDGYIEVTPSYIKMY